MKKLLLLLFALLLFNCELEDEDITSDTVIEDDTVIDSEPENPITPDEPELPIPDIDLSDILFGLYNGENMKFYDGETFEGGYIGKINYSGNRVLSIDDILYYMNADGYSEKSFRLPEVPDSLLVIENNSRALNPDDVWTLITVSAEESISLGSNGKIHTRVYQNDNEIGYWYLNEWEVKKTHLVATGEIIAESGTTKLYNISGETEPFKIYGDLYISDIDYTNKMACFHTKDGTEWVYYATNHFINGLWQEAEGVWYTSRGAKYIYGEGVTEGATALFGYAGAKDSSNEYYNFCPSGKQTENSEEVTYWINSTTGNLWKHIPSIDTFSIVKKIYNGSGSFVTGRTEFPDVKPNWIENKLYFNYEGNLQCYDPLDGSISVVSDSGEVFLW